MNFKQFLLEKEKQEIENQAQDLTNKIRSIFTDEDVVTVDTISAKAEELELTKDELENQIYMMLSNMIKNEDTDETDDESEDTDDYMDYDDDDDELR